MRLVRQVGAAAKASAGEHELVEAGALLRELAETYPVDELLQGTGDLPTGSEALAST